MTKKSKTIVFFGTEDFSAIALSNLLDQYNVDLVITKPDTSRGRGRKITAPLVKEIALKDNISVLQPASIQEANDYIAQLENPLGVLVSYGKIVPKSTLDLFPNGIVNIHPSLLPKYRGPSPIESAIANGDRETGVSLMYLSERMDAGPVITQKSLALSGTESQSYLYKKLAEIGSNLLLDFMEKYMSGAIIASSKQDETKATYTSLLSKDMTHIKPLEMHAIEIERKIRAHENYPKTRLPLLGEDRIVTAAHVSDSETKHSIECKNNTWLSVDKLISKNGKNISFKDLLNSLNIK